MKELISGKIEILNINYSIILEKNFCFRHEINIKFFLIVNNKIMYNVVKQL